MGTGMIPVPRGDAPTNEQNGREEREEKGGRASTETGRDAGLSDQYQYCPATN